MYIYIYIIYIHYIHIYIILVKILIYLLLLFALHTTIVALSIFIKKTKKYIFSKRCNLSSSDYFTFQ